MVDDGCLPPRLATRWTWTDSVRLRCTSTYAHNGISCELPSCERLCVQAFVLLLPTQFVLDRDHPNRIIFAPPDAPPDPAGAAAAATAAATAATQAPTGVLVGGSSAPGASAGMTAAAPAGATGSAEAGVPAATGPVDPIVDVVLVSGDLRAAIQVSWSVNVQGAYAVRSV